MGAIDFTMTTPCSNCPFRHDVEPYLLYDRVREIEEGSLINGVFPCHKTVNYEEWIEEDEDGNLVQWEPTGRERHCAGALILLEKMEMPSQMMRIMERLGGYDAGKLDMEAPVYEDWDEMAEAQSDY